MSDWFRSNPIEDPAHNDKVKCLKCSMWCTPQAFHFCSAQNKIVLAPA